ncbi:Transcription factor CBF/NF-Y/archaeal histone [Kalmanozyma brasiliensis GHG001]|uniref:Transcription factor CBF/NF-Y/archaeal histone n=1 Tax=Kalmanozyma brasiliensis (strain GHG001) TaxID=1365824 RepID=UPI0028680EAD|nr:Transcription factor CBF/NF-Y/archaeal histone [Kalmanozyma brasiliensis GHG001]EST07853.2 Transcription factor CBF/NF-Y/archaeal histone [Kalmanozyma brasiliensis GHG001]
MPPKKRSRASSITTSGIQSGNRSPLAHDLTGSGGAGASSSRAAATLPASGPLVHASQDLDDFQSTFWRYQMDLVEQGGDADGNVVDFKSGLPTQGQLPLARIKKVMKSDDQVKMISAEAPILFARACEIFISDLTCRAFLIAEEHKRRTIQRSDIAGAIGRSDLFDFLIDIVPRHESVPSSRLPGGGAAKREKTGEGKGVSRSNAGASSSRSRQHNEVASHDDHLLHGFSAAYDDPDASLSTDAVAATAESDPLSILHSSGHVDLGSTPGNAMAHWIQDTSADDHSSQSDHVHHAQHSHHHGPAPAQGHHHSGPSHEHHGHHHAGHHISSHHSHHHSPLDYVASSNAGTPNSIGAGGASGGAWSHTFSGF